MTRQKLFQRLTSGIIPLEQWAYIFANPQLNSFPSHQSKAFVVWFPTLNEFLSNSWERSRLIEQFTPENSADNLLLAHLEQLGELFKLIACLYSIEEQIYLRDRRLQSVHGVLHIYDDKPVDIRYCDPTNGTPVNKKIPVEEYRELLRRIIEPHGFIENDLRIRCLNSKQFAELHDYHLTKVKLVPHLANLASQLELPNVHVRSTYK